MKRVAASAFAPASVGNAAVGFDILGFALDEPGDEVRAHRVGKGKGSVAIGAITGCVSDLPRTSEKNTASVAALHLLKKARADFDVELDIIKGIPLGSGLGGSAASAVAAAVAVNALLKKPLRREELLESALAGESVATGSVHADNVAPCLLGGLQLVVSNEPLHVVPLRVPNRIFVTVVHPGIVIETKQARGILKDSLPLHLHVEQSALLAGFVRACMASDLKLLALTLKDLVIEPQRAGLIPGFYDAKNAAESAGALGFSISGAGPSVFAWSTSRASATKIGRDVSRAFKKHRLSPKVFVGPIGKNGAHLK